MRFCFVCFFLLFFLFFGGWGGGWGGVLVLKSAHVDCFQLRVDVNVPLQKGGSQPDLHVQFPLPGSHVSSHPVPHVAWQPDVTLK